MKKYLYLLLLLAITFPAFTQKIETDIFNDLKYASTHDQYRADFKKNIFEDFIFSDNQGNKLIFKKKYIDLQYGDLLKKKSEKEKFFRDLIYTNQKLNKYEATYSVDIFDKVQIEDNRNNKIEYGKDIFGNNVYVEKNSGRKSTTKRNVFGNLIFESDGFQATLKKDLFNKHIYEDSNNNTLTFSESTWEKMLQKHGSEEHILTFILNELLY